MQFVLVLLYVCLTGLAEAISPEKAVEVHDDPRILKLLPGLLCPLAVEPAIPANFVAMSPHGESCVADWVYWGSKEDLEAYFKDEKSLKEAILRVKISGNIAQVDAKGFGREHDLFLNTLQKERPITFAYRRDMWGSYPVVTIRDIADGQGLFVGWVGLNDISGGHTLLFNLVYPKEKRALSRQDCELWEHFFAKTQALEDQDFFRIHGQDLQPGYTVVNAAGIKLRMTAEKRQRDGMLQIVVIPSSSDVKFHYEKMEEGFMGAKWKCGQPLLKVYGTASNESTVADQVISILVQEVLEFSVKKDEGLDGKGYTVYQKLNKTSVNT